MMLAERAVAVNRIADWDCAVVDGGRKAVVSVPLCRGELLSGGDRDAAVASHQVVPVRSATWSLDSRDSPSKRNSAMDRRESQRNSELSRSERSIGRIIELLDILVKREIRFIAVKEDIRIDGRQDIRSKVTTTLFTLFAEVERNLISEQDGQARASGKRPGCPRLPWQIRAGSLEGFHRPHPRVLPAHSDPLHPDPDGRRPSDDAGRRPGGPCLPSFSFSGSCRWIRLAVRRMSVFISSREEARLPWAGPSGLQFPQQSANERPERGR